MRIPQKWPHEIVRRKDGSIIRMSFYCKPFEYDGKRIYYLDSVGLEGPGCFIGFNMYYEEYKAKHNCDGANGKRLKTWAEAAAWLAENNIIPARALPNV